LQYVLRLDAYLAQLVQQLGPWAYAAVFATIFAETGLVVAPFLPGESLLLTSGALAGADILTITVLAPLMFAPAWLGDVCNYLIGRFVGRHLLSKPRRYLRPEHVERARNAPREPASRLVRPRGGRRVPHPCARKWERAD
jgi:membrane-associated protein